AIACLRAAGVPVTHQRIEIARALFSAPVHLSADQIWANVREHAPDVSRATVYNTLRLFTEKHLVRELFVDPQRVVYDSTTAPHFHLYNMDTGEVRDLADDELQVIGTPRLPEGTVLQEADGIVRGRNRHDWTPHRSAGIGRQCQENTEGAALLQRPRCLWCAIGALRRAAYCAPSGTVTKPIFSMPAVRAFDITSAITS